MKKVIVISGGTEGLGKAIAFQLSPKNHVIILSPTESKLEKVARAIKCDYQICDVSSWASVELAIKNVVKKYKRIDCLINNAGLYIEQELELDDPDEIKRVLEVNTLGVFYLTKAVIPVMRKQKNGLIININSQSGLIGQNGKTIYNATKGAVHIFTKSLQIELQKYGIAVTGIYPGKMNTDMFKNMGITKDMTNALDPKYIAKTIEFILSFDNKAIFPELGIKHPDN